MSTSEPLKFFLDEAISGETMVAGLRSVGYDVEPFEALGFVRSDEVEDERVLARTSERGGVLMTRDLRMESRHLESVCRFGSKLVLLTDRKGRLEHFVACLVCAQEAIFRRMAGPGPRIVRVGRSGQITTFRDADEIVRRAQQAETQRQVRRKKG